MIFITISYCVISLAASAVVVGIGIKRAIRIAKEEKERDQCS